MRVAKWLSRRLKGTQSSVAETLPIGARSKLVAPARTRVAEPAAAISTAWQQHFSNVFGFAEWTESVLGSEPVDICIVHDSFALEAARLLKKKTGCALVFDAVEYPDYTGRFGRMAEAFSREESGHALVLAHEQLIHEMVDVLIVGTRGVQEWFAANKKLPPATIVRNCLDFEVMHPDDRIRNACGLSPDDRLVLLPNSVHMSSYIVETFEALRYLPANVHLATMGNTPKPVRNELETKLAAWGVAHRVHFLPLRSPADLLQYRSGADISVIPLDPEIPVYRSALPNRVFESIMSRHPLAISNLPFIREVVEQFSIGGVFETSAPQAIAETIRAILDRLPEHKKNVETAAKTLCWKNERDVFINAMRPVLPEERPRRVVCIANKRLTTNRRVFRHTRTLAELGHEVRVLSLFAPLDVLKDDRVRYDAMQSNDRLASLLGAPGDA
ncbi:MAG TPA: glycosyltransferase [Rhizobiaceae bacterium]|nr:glycosyltransferase [Rhizobiaceae bacterium]